MINNLEIKWLYDLLALEENRNFTVAAEKRNISQSSFSRHIQALESALGFDLIDRQVNPLQLSKKGKIFHTYVRNILFDIEYQIAKINGGDQIKQAITIAAAHSIAVFLLPDLLYRYPEYTKNTFFIEAINVDEAVHNLKEGKSDFIFSFHNEELTSAPFLHYKVLDAGLHLTSVTKNNGKPLFDLSILPVPFMGYTEESYMGRKINQYQNRKKIFSPCFVSSMSELLKSMILQGAGVGWLPDYMIKQELNDGSLVILGEKEYSITTSIYIYRFATRLTPASERFWNFIKSGFV